MQKVHCLYKELNNAYITDPDRTVSMDKVVSPEEQEERIASLVQAELPD